VMVSDSWVFRTVPGPGESFGHFLGRFRRANELSHKAIADHLGVRVEWAKAWESPSHLSFNMIFVLVNKLNVHLEKAESITVVEL
jgi:hypothetical protein